MGHDIKNKQLNLFVNLSAEFHHLIADPARLQQVFWNIIKNAIKFTPEGGSIFIDTRNAETEETADMNGTINLQVNGKKEEGEICEEEEDYEESPEQRKRVDEKKARGQEENEKIAISSRKESEDETNKVDEVEEEEHSNERTGSTRVVWLVVSMRDTGIGIEPQVIPHLFHAFNQGDTSITVQYGGLGLGLAISKYAQSLSYSTLKQSSGVLICNKIYPDL